MKVKPGVLEAARGVRWRIEERHRADDPEFLARLEDEDRLLALSAITLRQMKGDVVVPFAEEILAYLAHRGVDDPARRYAERHRQLDALQRRFEAEGRYPASSYAEVPEYDRELCAIGLLVSQIVALHRFELLEAFLEFLALPSWGPRRLASVGFGTGYELRWARHELPGWEIEGFETSRESVDYAADLLAWFGSDGIALRNEVFPLDSDDGIERHLRRYGKLVFCELLEHLERPASALRRARRVLHPGGHAFFTAAIRIAQEDHVFLYESVDEAREQVESSGFSVEREYTLPVAVMPFPESRRREVFRRGNWACVARLR